MRKLILLALPMALAACTPSDRANENADRTPDPAVAPATTPTTPQSMTATPESTPPTQTPTQSRMGASTAVLASTAGNTAAGTLSLSTDGGGVRITGELTGLSSTGEHGFHIHEKGDCSAPDASSAGGHFNPAGTPHGRPDSGQHHAGDMYNIVADAEGNARVDALAAGVMLGGGSGTDVVGKAIVLHKKADDYTSQPAGDSGDRIACGVIR